MLRRTRFILPVFTLLTSLFMLQPSHAATIQLPQTGQTGCWDASGGAIACSGTGQDGDKKMGAVWPNPRFTDNGNGTITDNLTGLIWLQNANCTDTVGGIAKASGYLTWANALIWSNSLASGLCGLADSSSAGDWRLPNINELESLIDEQNTNPALPVGHPFSAVQAYYWSSTTYANNTNNAWNVNMNNGNVNNNNKTNNNYVWPVRGGEWKASPRVLFAELYQSYLRCRRNKRSTLNAMRFESNAEENLYLLAEELADETYRPSRSIRFAVDMHNDTPLYAIKQTIEAMQRLRGVVASYSGHFKFADTRRLRRSIFRRYPWLNALYRLDGDVMPRQKRITL